VLLPMAHLVASLMQDSGMKDFVILLVEFEAIL
jgi:hypothetical protein